jgi:hypothetical protein
MKCPQQNEELRPLMQQIATLLLTLVSHPMPGRSDLERLIGSIRRQMLGAT